MSSLRNIKQSKQKFSRSKYIIKLTVIVGIENKYFSVDLESSMLLTGGLCSDKSSLHSSAANKRIHCNVYRSFTSVGPIACIFTLTLLWRRVTAQCITCGRAVCSSLHLDIWDNPPDKYGDRPICMFCTRTFSKD